MVQQARELDTGGLASGEGPFIILLTNSLLCSSGAARRSRNLIRALPRSIKRCIISLNKLQKNNPQFMGFPDPDDVLHVRDSNKDRSYTIDSDKNLSRDHSLLTGCPVTKSGDRQERHWVI